MLLLSAIIEFTNQLLVRDLGIFNAVDLRSDQICLSLVVMENKWTIYGRAEHIALVRGKMC